MKKFLVVVGSILSLPVMSLSFFAPVVCVVWLLILHEWRLLIIGVVVGFVATKAIATLVGGLLMIAYALRTRPLMMRLTIRFTQAATFVLIVAYSVLVFEQGLQRAHGNVWPYALWGYATAISPWAAFASRVPRGDPGAVVWCSAAQFGGTAALIAIVSGNVRKAGVIFIFAALFGCATGWAMVSEVKTPSPRGLART